MLMLSSCLAATDSDTSLEGEHFPELVTASGSSPVRTISDKKTTCIPLDISAFVTGQLTLMPNCATAHITQVSWPQRSFSDVSSAKCQ